MPKSVRKTGVFPATLLGCRQRYFSPAAGLRPLGKNGFSGRRHLLSLQQKGKYNVAFWEATGISGLALAFILAAGLQVKNNPANLFRFPLLAVFCFRFCFC